MRVRWWVVGGVLVLAAAGCGDGGEPPGTSPESSPPAAPAEGPVGDPLSANDIAELAAQFGDQPLTGGQTAPRLYRWVNDRVAIFLQFDSSELTKATALRYIGVSVKGVFCAEDQPGGPDGGFPHFHRLEAPSTRRATAGRPVRRDTG